MTLVLRMWPMLQTAKANRTLIRAGLSQLAEKTFAIARGQGLGITTGGRYYEPDLPALLPRDREQQVLEVSTLWGNGANPLISPERALDVLDVPEDERGDELSRLQKIRDEANALERDMLEMEMEMKEREFALKAKELELEMSLQEQQLALDRRKADQERVTVKPKAKETR